MLGLNVRLFSRICLVYIAPEVGSSEVVELSRGDERHRGFRIVDTAGFWGAQGFKGI